MKKKLVAAMMVAVMTAGMVMPVSADTGVSSKNLTVGYEEESTFVLSIPAEVTLSETAGTIGTVGLSSINVSTTEKVQIRVTSGISAEGAVTLTDMQDPGNNCTSTVRLEQGGDPLASDGIIAEFTMDSNSLTAALYFTALGNVPAGTYSGQMTYQASIVSTADAGATGE